MKVCISPCLCFSVSVRPHLYDGLQLLQFDLEHVVLSLQLEDLLFLGPVLDVILQLQALPPLHLTLLFHLVQAVFQLVNLHIKRETIMKREQDTRAQLLLA